MAANGRLSKSSLAPIPGGELRRDAAAAWNALCADARRRGLTVPMPTGSASSYRTLAEQQRFWALYQAGGNLAAVPGSSNHGWGLAVDVGSWAGQQTVHKIGAKYGWAKQWSDAPSEPWHFKWRADVWKPRPSPLRFLKGIRRRASSTLLMRRRRRAAEERGGKGPRWRAANRAVKRSRPKVAALRRRASGRAKRVLKRVLGDRDGQL